MMQISPYLTVKKLFIGNLVLLRSKMMKSFGDAKLVGPLLIGLGLPIEVAPLRSSTSDILNLASVAAYSSDIIDYEND